MKHKRISIPVILHYIYHETEPLPDNPDELEPAQDPTDLEVELPDGDCFEIASGFSRGCPCEEIPAHIWLTGGFQTLGPNDRLALKTLLGPHRQKELEPQEVQWT